MNRFRIKTDAQGSILFRMKWLLWPTGLLIAIAVLYPVFDSGWKSAAPMRLEYSVSESSTAESLILECNIRRLQSSGQKLGIEIQLPEVWETVWLPGSLEILAGHRDSVITSPYSGKSSFRLQKFPGEEDSLMLRVKFQKPESLSSADSLIRPEIFITEDEILLPFSRSNQIPVSWLMPFRALSLLENERNLIELYYQAEPETFSMILGESQQVQISIRDQKGDIYEAIFDGTIRVKEVFEMEIGNLYLPEGDYLFWMEGEYFKEKMQFLKQRGKWRFMSER